MDKKLIVVGGGYAGTEVIRQLVNRGVRDVEIELISNKPCFENTIGGTELISEKAKLEELKYDLKELSDYWNFELTLGAVENIDLKASTVKVANEQKTYDILVLAMGSEPNFFGVKGANLADPAYSLDDFVNINKKLRELDKTTPNVVVAGAGFVGFEAAAETLDLFKTLGREVKITMIEKMNSVLPAYNNLLARQTASEIFISRGVKFIVGNGIEAVESDKLILQDGSSVQSDLTIWTAGVKGCLLSSEIAGGNLYRGCVTVDKRLLINGTENAFSIGDVAYVKINDKEATKMAGEALEQAKTTAKNIIAMVKGGRPSIFHVPSYVTDYPQALLSMGEGKAMLVLGPHYMSVGATEYFLKKRIDFQEMMDRFPR